MLDQGIRTAILSLRAKGHGIRHIARALQISRGAVRMVLKAGTPTVPRIERAEKAEPHAIRSSSGSIAAAAIWCGSTMSSSRRASRSYPALTAFAVATASDTRRRCPSHYDFHPAQEMQHDTSPHRMTIAGVEQRIETASLVLCYSRMLFFQVYPAFTRFYCKVFLTDALEYLGGGGRDVHDR